MRLTESPTHVIEHLKQAVQAGEFTETNAFLFAGLAILVNGLNKHNPSPAAIDKIAHEPARSTTQRFENLVKRASPVELQNLTKAFRADNAQFILNHLNRFEKQLVQLYDEFEVNIYNDR